MEVYVVYYDAIGDGYSEASLFSTREKAQKYVDFQVKHNLHTRELYDIVVDYVDYNEIGD